MMPLPGAGNILRPTLPGEPLPATAGRETRNRAYPGRRATQDAWPARDAGGSGRGLGRASDCAPARPGSRKMDSRMVSSNSFLQGAQHVPDPVLAAQAEPVRIRPPDQHGLSAERQRLEHVRAAADAAVEQDRRSGCRPTPTTAGSASSAAMAPSTWRPPWLDTMIPSIPAPAARRASRRMQDALENDRAVPVIPCERQVIPGQRAVAEDHACHNFRIAAPGSAELAPPGLTGTPGR